MISNRFLWAVPGIGIAMLLAGPAACGLGPEMVEIDNDDIGGVIISEQGPEAGVWVIAETQDLPTKYIKIVTTDDNGQYVLPDLPEAERRELGCRVDIMVLPTAVEL